MWALLVLLVLPSEAGRCADLGCGGHDETCYCVPSCWSWDDCCEDMGSVCPEEPARLQLGEMNFLVTTDLHSWVSGRTHQPHLNASLAHVAHLHQELRARARVQNKDLFFFDNGDINDGTGLSASAGDHVAYVAPVLRSAAYDALNVGNHELYQRNCKGLLPGVACPVVGLKESGYIDSWKGRYLSSNVVWAENAEPVGSRYTVITGESGRKVLVFGFLYNMEDHCDAVQVQRVEDVVASRWFLEALEEPCDAVVVLAHMDYRDELVDVIWRSIRQRHPRTPLTFLAGHSHIRGYRQLDNFSAVFEAGCKLDTVGFLSFTARADGSGVDFVHANITGNVAAMAGALQHPVLPDARVQSSLMEAHARTNSDKILGCAAKHLHVYADLSRQDSLWAFYMTEVLPKTLLKGDEVAIVGTGALSYDIYPGPFTVNDAFTTSPYGNAWLLLRSIPGSVLRDVLRDLNARASHDSRAKHASLSERLPHYVASQDLEDRSYDLVLCEYDLEIFQEHLSPLVPHELRAEVYRMNTSSVLEEWFSKQPCPEAVVV